MARLIDIKIYLANSSEQKIGGGWTWLSNFRKAMGEMITEDYEEANVYLIPSGSMVGREEVQKAKEDNKRIVLRVDNALRNSRNRNTGMTRMKDFAKWANLIVYQSNWARKYLMPFLNHDGVVIHNSIDTSLFNPYNRQPQDRTIYLYTRFNRDETKNWEVARYWYSVKQRQDHNAELWIVGNYSPELIEGNFDFYHNERYKFLGVQPLENMVSIYKQTNYLIFTYFNDACSNTLIEALCCGVNLSGYDLHKESGGSPEILARFEDPFNKEQGLEYFGLERMARQYKEAIERL